MYKSNNRLEQALCFWEDICFICSTANRAGKKKDERRAPLAGGMEHAGSFRDALLGVVSTEQTYDPQHYHVSAEFTDCPAFNRIPEAIFRWTTRSRRIFGIDDGLQTLFEQTPLDGILWNQVPWPFGAFAVNFGHPLTYGDQAFDACIFFKSRSRESATLGRVPFVSFLLLPTCLEELDFMTEEERRDLVSRLKNQPSHKIYPILESLHARYIHPSPMLPYASLKADGNPAILHSPKELIGGGAHTAIAHNITEAENHLFETLFRIMVGLCFYLRLGKIGARYKQVWKPVQETTPDPKAITASAEVCTVKCSFEFDPKTNVKQYLLGAPTGRELCAHWRRGHWRRLWFRKDEEGLPRRTWVRPTLVRSDRVPTNAVPAGSACLTK